MWKGRAPFEKRRVNECPDQMANSRRVESSCGAIATVSVFCNIANRSFTNVIHFHLIARKHSTARNCYHRIELITRERCTMALSIREGCRGWHESNFDFGFSLLLPWVGGGCCATTRFTKKKLHSVRVVTHRRENLAIVADQNASAI